jgi:hypothetical protein
MGQIITLLLYGIAGINRAVMLVFGVRERPARSRVQVAAGGRSEQHHGGLCFLLFCSAPLADGAAAVFNSIRCYVL